MQPPLIIAHRTCPLDAPENSLAGLKKAAELGADAVEVDLRLSVDGRPFLMHDNFMRRTTDFALPLELTPASVIRRQRLRDSDEGVPRLEEVFEALPAGLKLAVDVKTPWAIAALMGEIKRRGIDEQVLVWCTSALAASYAVRHAPTVEVAYLKTALDVDGKRALLRRAKRIGARAVSAHWLAIDGDFVGEAHDLGLRVYSYHAGYALAESKLRAGLDGLITDRPREARAAFAALGEQSTGSG